MTQTKLSDPVRVLLKIMAAFLGGYIFTTAFIIWLSFIWPARLADAMQTGLMLGFAVYTAAMVWAFSQRNWQRAWLAMLLPAAVFWGWVQWLN